MRPSVRMSIASLTFSAKGYEQAEKNLSTKYGQQREVSNAFVYNTMNLPTIPGANLSKAYDFYEWLLTSAQASETKGRLADIKEYTGMTLGKLPNVWPDPV